MKYIILIAIAIWLAGCGFEVDSTAPDDNVQVEQTIDTVFITKLDTVSQITYWPCTTYVHDTSIVTYTDTVIDTYYTTVRDTIRVNDTIQLIDTCTLIQYDTTIQMIHDTIMISEQIHTDSSIDTLPRLPSEAQFEHVQFILTDNTLILGYPDSYAGYAKTISLIIQTETGIDTLKNQRVDKISDRPLLIKVSPVNECIGLLGFHNGNGWLSWPNYAFKVCDDD